MSSSTAWAARDLSLQRVLSLLEQFYASVLWRDEHSGPDDDTTTFKLVPMLQNRCVLRSGSRTPAGKWPKGKKVMKMIKMNRANSYETKVN